MFTISCGIYSANMENKWQQKTLLLTLPYALQFLFSLILVLRFREMAYPARVIGCLLGFFPCALAVFVGAMRRPGRLIVHSDWKYGLRLSVPSIAMSVSYMLMQQCDKMMITGICGAEETAVYSVIFYMGYALLAINQAIAPVRQAWVFKHIETVDRSVFQNLQKWYLIGIAFLATGVLMVAPEAVKILAPESYWKYEYIAPFVLSACLSISCGFYSELAMYHKKNLQLSISVMAAAALNIGLNAILIPRVGAVAAAYTTVAAYLLLHVLSSVVIRKVAGGMYSKRMFLFFGLYIIAACAMASPFLNRPFIRYPVFAVLLAVMMLYVLKHKSEWINVVKKENA